MKLVSSYVAFGVVVAACGGAPSQVSFVANERPGASGERLDPTVAEAHNEHTTTALPQDESVVEPDHPLADTKQERALVHVHAPGGVTCSGVVLDKRIVATAQHCLKGEAKGATAIASDREYRIEVPSSGLTWTNRRAKYALLPECDEDELDVGLLVLADAAAWVEPLVVTSVPPEGAHVQALGFGHCAGETRRLGDRTGTIRRRASDELVIDVPLCHGDVGGPVVYGGDVLGLISHRDDPDGSPLRTTAITRLDTRRARRLVTEAKTVADAEDPAKAKLVRCRSSRAPQPAAAPAPTGSPK